MPLFMLISGYLFASKLDNINNDRYIAFNIVQSRFLQILMPYIVWTLLVISYKTLISGFSIISLSEFSTNLWFLKCLFLCILVAVCGRLLFNNTFIFVVFTLLLTHVGSLLTTYNVSGLYPAFILGYLYKRNEVAVCKHNKILCVVTGLTFLTMICNFDYSFFEYTSLNFYRCCFMHDSYTSTDAYKEIYKLLIGLFGASFFFFLAKSLEHYYQQYEVITFLSKIGSATLGIYILQNIYLERILATLISVDTNKVFFNLCIVPVGAAIISLLCFYTVKLIRRNSITKFLLLGERYNKK